MPTEQCLKQYTKVQAYLDEDLLTKLEAWIKEKILSNYPKV